MHVVHGLVCTQHAAAADIHPVEQTLFQSWHVYVEEHGQCALYGNITVACHSVADPEVSKYLHAKYAQNFRTTPLFAAESA